MNPNDIPEAGWTWQLFAGIGIILPLVVNLAGLAITVWAFLRCRKCGYLVIAAYFAVIVLWSYIWMPIHRSIEAHRPPDASQQMQQAIDKAVEKAADETQVQTGRPLVFVQRKIYLPFGPIALVAGLWLLAKRETPVS